MFPMAFKHNVVQPLLKQVGQQQLYFVLQKSLFHLHVIVNVLLRLLKDSKGII